jgi:hypothetical protein
MPCEPCDTRRVSLQTEHVNGFLEDLADLSDHVSDQVNKLLPGDELPRPGQLAAKAGLQAHHPIVIIPGAILVLHQGCATVVVAYEGPATPSSCLPGHAIVLCSIVCWCMM